VCTLRAGVLRRLVSSITLDLHSMCCIQSADCNVSLSVKPKVMWQQIKPHLDLLISRFVFPCLCLTDEEVEQFDDDPVEYCRAHFGGIFFLYCLLLLGMKPDSSISQTSSKTGSPRHSLLLSALSKSWSSHGSLQLSCLCSMSSTTLSHSKHDRDYGPLHVVNCLIFVFLQLPCRAHGEREGWRTPHARLFS
jgi:hypothetical protein